MAKAISTNPTDERDYTPKIQRAINDTGADNMELFRDKTRILPLLKKMTEFINSVNEVWMYFTSLCRFPIRDADFGWGKPLAVLATKMGDTNMVSFRGRKWDRSSDCFQQGRHGQV